MKKKYNRPEKKIETIFNGRSPISGGSDSNQIDSTKMNSIYVALNANSHFIREFI